jgi:hypothetical protein
VEDRARALEQIASLARQHGLSAAEIAAALDRRESPASSNRLQRIVVRVLGFLGGTFVFAGLGVFVATQWDDMNSAARVLVTLGSGIAALVLAIAATREPRFDKVAAPFLLMAAVLEPTGMFVAFNEYGSGGDWRIANLITAGAMALQFAAVFASLRRSTPLFVTFFFAVVFWWTALDLLDVDEMVIAMVLGASIIFAAVAVDRAGRGEITPFWYFCGAFGFLAGFFDVVKRTPFEILFIAVAAGFVYASVVLHSRTLLAVATLAILAYTGWFTGEHFVDSVGWPLALIAFGLVLIGLSALAFRIDREYVRPR